MKMDYSGVENCCAELEACLRRIKSIHDDFEAQIKKIKGGSVWAGPGSEGFVEKCQKTMTICRNMETSLQNLIRYIRTCKQNYQRTDNSIEQMLNQFKF